MNFLDLNFFLVPIRKYGADSKSIGRLEKVFELGKFEDDYWLSCRPMRTKAKVTGNLVHFTEQYKVYTNSGNNQM